MAQWNPYLGLPNQNNSAYEEQNLGSQNYYNVHQTLPYSLPLQQLSYNNYYMPGNLYSNFSSDTVYNVQDLEAQQFGCYLQSSNSVRNSTATEDSNFEKKNAAEGINTNAPVTSKLTPTAAEFKPSSSTASNASLNSQTFYSSSHNQFANKDDNHNSKGAVRKQKELKNENRNGDDSAEADYSQFSSNGVVGRSSGFKPSNESLRQDSRRYKNSQNYTNGRYSRFHNKNDRNYQDRNFGRDENLNSGESQSANKNQNDRKTRYNKYENSNRENNFGRNSRRQQYSNRDDIDVDSQSDTANKSKNYQKNDAKSSPVREFRHYKYENRENNYGRNFRDSDRNDGYVRENYGRSSVKNSYRSNRYDKSYENWRSPSGSDKPAEKDDGKKSQQKNFDKDRRTYKDQRHADKMVEDDISQRDRLTEQVNRGTLECLVCCERVRQADKIWHCQKCYHIFHLRCIIKWGNTSKDDNGWRCPACQHVSDKIPSSYFCYCGKVNEPPYTPGDTAHSCGDVCGRIGVKPGCVHRCNLLCHPGPCPKCEALVSRNCNCGATKQMVKCSTDIILVCTAICNKLKNCGVHCCQKTCHGGDCDECSEIIHQDCHCGKTDRTIPCCKEQNNIKEFSCEEVCNKVLSCGNHNCKEICHPGDCPPCIRAPDQVKTCPCGKSKLEDQRTSCLDPITCCEKICGKRYSFCGNAEEPHVCKSVCHEGPCPPCPLNSFARCRCGHMNREFACSELMSKADDIRCEKKCVKKRSCGKHKCNQLCCIDIDHICPLPCNHMLSCGQHRCEQTCHKGRCQPCWRVSFEELYCECGISVIYPPIPCGTKKPHCTQPCAREHECEHEALHTCHSLPECPPCTVLTTKVCYGGHEQRTTIPCHQKEFSCGLPCGKELSCGRHKCQLPCHKGPCLKEGQECTQSCSAVRENCGHPCGLPCHEMPCPESPCKEMVKVTCECGLRSSTRACVDVAREYQRIATSMLASKMADMQRGHSIDIADIVGTNARKQNYRTLECNDECRLIERNRRLAIGLQIRNPDLSAKLTPRYSDFMRQWAKKDPRFCQLVHDKLTELVQLAKQSKQKSRSYSFPSANRDKRHFIHEYCQHFGCESAAYDEEPNRNVVATASKDKAWLPSCSVLELLQRENGQRKVPGPILNRPLGVQKSSSDTVSLKVPVTAKSSKSNTTTTTPSTSFSSTVQRSKTPEPEDIDYFECPKLNRFNYY